jgi:hypothetical protein
MVEAAKRVSFLPDPEQVLQPEMQQRISIPPDLEFSLMTMGHDLLPHLSDDHHAHLQAHQIQLQSETMKAEQGQPVDEQLLQRLQIHMQKTQEMIAKMQQQTPTGMPGQAPQPGQLLSQNTSGTKAANTMSPQTPGQAPAKKEEVVQ